MTTRLGNYRTVIGATVATVIIGCLVRAGSLTASRAIVPLVFAWMFALHASDYRAATEEQAQALLAGKAKAD